MEVHALLDLMRKNQTRLQGMPVTCVAMLTLARQSLTILDPEVGEEELIQAVAAALAKLRSC